MHRSFLALFAVACVPVLESEDVRDTAPWSWEAPDNRWPQSTPPEGLVGEGFDEGDVIPDFRLSDQYGDETSLWQFHGRVVVVDISAIWCSPCRELAEHTEETWALYADDGLVYVTVLPENNDRESPTIEDLQAWASQWGISQPIVADVDRAWSRDAVPPPADAFPRLFVVAPDLTIAHDVIPQTDAALRVAIEDVLGR